MPDRSAGSVPRPIATFSEATAAQHQREEDRGAAQNVRARARPRRFAGPSPHARRCRSSRPPLLLPSSCGSAPTEPNEARQLSRALVQSEVTPRTDAAKSSSARSTWLFPFTRAAHDAFPPGRPQREARGRTWGGPRRAGAKRRAPRRGGIHENGNRTSAPSQTLTYDAQDRISTSGYQHDNDGRMTTPNGGTHTYTWDDFGSLVSVSLPNNVVIQYTYDGLQRRVTRQKLINGIPQTNEELRYLYAEDGRLVAILDINNNVLDQYIYATGSHTPDAVVIDNTALYRIAQDHLGSVRMVIKASDGTSCTDCGTVAQRVDYDAFGTITTQTGAGFQAFGFAGGLVDADTGLVQMGARWYRPAIGRFISKDPTLFGGGDNLYAYANGDPVNFVDPDGTLPILPVIPPLAKGAAVVIGGIAAGIGVGIWAFGDEPLQMAQPQWGNLPVPQIDSDVCDDGSDDDDHCQEHLNRCLETPLGKKHSGGKWGRSRCRDCFDRCRAEGGWPIQTYDRKSCNYGKSR